LIFNVLIFLNKTQKVNYFCQMKITARDLAHILGGSIEGDPSVSVSKPGKIEYGKPGEICFLGNPKYEDYAYTTEASILLVDKNFVPRQSVKPTLIKVDNVYTSLALLLEKFGSVSHSNNTISEKASVHPSVLLGKNVHIGDFCIIEEGVSIGDNTYLKGQNFIGKNTIIGDDCIFHIGVKIYADCIIQARCIFHAGVVIGADGFGFAPQADGSYKKIHHVGNVIIENDVEIGANTTVDRASIGSTIIRQGVKLDNLIQIAHNVEIGENTVIAAQTGVSGSTKIGKNCRIGGQAGLAGHLTIGDNVQIQAQSGVASNIASNSKLFGYPAIDYNAYLKAYAVFKNLPDIYKRFLKIEKKNNL
jgi:UDP-3-O-[3-hydroxymyristoyl] glucosamine N-acyltransferase